MNHDVSSYYIYIYTIINPFNVREPNSFSFSKLSLWVFVYRVAAGARRHTAAVGFTLPSARGIGQEEARIAGLTSETTGRRPPKGDHGTTVLVERDS